MSTVLYVHVDKDRRLVTEKRAEEYLLEDKSDAAQLARTLDWIDRSYLPLLQEWGFEQITDEFPTIDFRSQRGCTVSFIFEKYRYSTIWSSWGSSSILVQWPGALPVTLLSVEGYFEHVRGITVPEEPGRDTYRPAKLLKAFAPELFVDPDLPQTIIDYEIAPATVEYQTRQEMQSIPNLRPTRRVRSCV